MITSHSARLLGSHLQLSPGVGRVLLKLVEAQRRSHGDGGLTVVAFAAKILRKSAAEIHHAGMDVHKLIDEISSAMDALEEFLMAPATNDPTMKTKQNDPAQHGMLRRVKLNDLATMKSLVMTMLRPKIVFSMSIGTEAHEEEEEEEGERHLESIATKILDAILSSLDPERAEPFVQILTVEGGSMEGSFSAPHTVLMDIPLPLGAELAASTGVSRSSGTGLTAKPLRVAL